MCCLPKERVAKIHIDHNVAPIGIEPIILYTISDIQVKYEVARYRGLAKRYSRAKTLQRRSLESRMSHDFLHRVSKSCIVHGSYLVPIHMPTSASPKGGFIRHVRIEQSR